MAVIGRSPDDILIDKIVQCLSDFSKDQAAIDPAVKFGVKRDLVRMPSMRDMPLVNVWLEGIDPQREGSSGKLAVQELARINIDCYTKGYDQTELAPDEGIAMKRLYYLKEQVKHALYSLVNSDFGLPVGTIARKHWPSWEVFTNDLSLPESEVVAGRWRIEIEYIWIPEDIEAVQFEGINIDTDKWSAWFDYNKEEED